MQKRNKKSTKRSDALWREAKSRILGGVSLLSKKPERFLREGWPAYMRSAKGITIVDQDGNTWKDFTYMGVGPNLLGYADRDVDTAVMKVIKEGNQSTLNAPEEVALARELLKLHPWAGMVRYARSGGEIAAIAIRIARAHSGRDKVAFCGYHGWHDWYLATNLARDKNLDGHLLPGLQPLGVPRALEGTALPFTFNKIEELEALIEQHKDIGVIAMEPMRHQEPTGDFLKKVRAIADRIGAVLIFDEISSGFRIGFPGAHMRFKVTPDIVIYSKAISNGYPMAALVGKEEVMREAQASFISSTYHSERIGPAAALATLRKLKRLNAVKKIDQVGWQIGKVWQRLAKKHGLPLVVEGPGAFINFHFSHDDNAVLKALYTQEMLAQGYLATPTMYPSLAHTSQEIARYATAADCVFGVLSDALKKGDALQRLRGGLPESGFKRLT